MSWNKGSNFKFILSIVSLQVIRLSGILTITAHYSELISFMK